MNDASAPPMTPTSANPPPYSVAPPQTESAHVTALGRHGREDAIVTRTKDDGNVTVTATYTATYNESAVRRFIRRRRMLSIISFIVSLLIILGVLIPVVILPALRDSSGSSKPGDGSGSFSGGSDSPGNPPPSKSKPKWTYSKTTGKCYTLTSTETFNGGVSSCESLGGTTVSIHSASEGSVIIDALKASDGFICFIGLSYTGPTTYDRHGWEWADGTKFDYAAWANGQPFLVNDQLLSNCVTVGTYKNGWSTENGCNGPYGMMCQKPAKKSGGSPCE